MPYVRIEQACTEVWDGNVGWNAHTKQLALVKCQTGKSKLRPQLRWAIDTPKKQSTDGTGYRWETNYRLHFFAGWDVGMNMPAIKEELEYNPTKTPVLYIISTEGDTIYLYCVYIIPASVVILGVWVGGSKQNGDKV